MAGGWTTGARAGRPMSATARSWRRWSTADPASFGVRGATTRRLTGAMARLFVAIWPPEDVVEVLMGLRRKDQRGVRFVRPENWHVTLRFLGAADPAAVSAALDGVVPAPARARLGPAVDVIAERALVVPVRGVDDLAARRRRGDRRHRRPTAPASLRRPPHVGAREAARPTPGEHRGAGQRRVRRRRDRPRREPPAPGRGAATRRSPPWPVPTPPDAAGPAPATGP